MFHTGEPKSHKVIFSHSLDPSIWRLFVEFIFLRSLYRVLESSFSTPDAVQPSLSPFLSAWAAAAMHSNRVDLCVLNTPIASTVQKY